MRTQNIVTIDTGLHRRAKGESDFDFYSRLDQMLTMEINAWQNKPSWKNWDLLSVAPGHKIGVYITTWEYDPQQHEDVKSEDSDAAEPTYKGGYLKGGLFITDETSKFPNLEYIGDSPFKGEINHGDIIRVNGVLFHMVGFTRDGTGSYVDFLEDDAMPLEKQDDPTGTLTRYGREFHGVRRSVARNIVANNKYGRG